MRPLLCLVILAASALAARGQRPYEQDTIATLQGPLHITFIGHAAVMFTWQDRVVHVDPVTREADYATLPKADLVLITHEHRDHLDTLAWRQIRKVSTVIAIPPAGSAMVPEGIVLRNGEVDTLAGFPVEAVPAYNVVHKRSSGEPFHPPGRGNGYVVAFGETRVYIAGDTEDIPEMQELGDITIAFLPMNLPYTMTPEMAANAARMVRPKILYPYHYGNSDVQRLVELLREEKGIEVRIRQMH
ncbi:MAG: MBL fold metallo-hydrolase [bacterium]|jgi:L-ascorbate metabolism protein UlaG (beta-lactamase superfamily)|nr:MBL fold metallo-hydrolase [candidate division KSB1 bacterium]MDH7560766.1 MBL fold metallo-hydrolase [bacterium]